MQLFNGILFHKKLLVLESTAGGDSGTDSKEKSLVDLKNEVDELLPSDQSLENDEIKDIENLCTLELANELSGKQEEVKSMLKTIDEWLNKTDNQSSGARNSVIKLRDFLKSIVDNSVFSNVGDGSSQEKSEDPQSLDENLSSKKVELVQKFDSIVEGGRFSSTLTNIKTVLDNPTPSKVKQLQQYIFDAVYAKLSVSEQGKFRSAPRFQNNQWNGVIDTELLEGVDIVFTRIENTLKSQEEAAKGKDGNGGVDVVNPAAQAPEAQDAPKQKSKFFANYSVAGVQVAEMAASMVLYSPDAKPAVEGDVSSGSDSDERSSKGIDQNNVSIAVEKLKALGSAGESTENVYLTEVGGKPYAVRLDSEGCLYPFAVDLTSNRLVFLKNNTSCIKYLENKLDDKVPNNDAYIVWNGTRYVIGRHSDHEKSRLLIEPTTIAGQWVSPDLGKCLAFLNFTNYLRNETGLDRGKFKNDNPDLKWRKDGKLFVRVKKMDKHDYDKNIDDSERWMYVDLQDFGLEGVSQESDEWRKFIKYNNSEQWEDLRHFDKLDDKFDYSTLDIQAVLDKQARRDRAEARARAGAPNPGAQPGGGLGKESTVDGSYGRDVLDSNSGTLKAVDQDFDRGNFGILEADVTVFVLNGSYYYQKGGVVHQVTGFTDQDATLSEGQSLSNGQNISELKLNFSQAKNLEITEGGAGALNSKLKDVYRSIVDKVLGNDVKISVSENRNSYVLNLGNDKSIILGGENFVKDGKIFGYDIDKPEEWMKVVCYAVDNYENLAKSGVVSVNEIYGINKDNVSLVNEWLGVLNVQDLSKNLIAIDNFVDLGLSVKTEGVNKKDLNIPEGSVVYTGSLANALYYKGLDSRIYMVSTDFPYQKTEVKVDGSLNNWDVNVCKAGANSLKINFSDDEKVKGYLCDSESGAPNINVLVTDEGNYQFENGGVKIIINPNDPVYNSGGFCGVSVIYDRFKLVSLASIVKSKCEGNNVKYVSDKGIIVDGGDGSTENVLASIDVLRAFWGIDGDGNIQSTNLDSFVSYCNGLKVRDQGDKAYVYSNETSAAV